MSRRVAIVTGASQGIGRSTAIRLARDFASVVLVARNRENLDQTADDVKKAGAEPLAIDLDLSRPEAAQEVVDQTLSGVNRRAVDNDFAIFGVIENIPDRRLVKVDGEKGDTSAKDAYRRPRLRLRPYFTEWRQHQITKPDYIRVRFSQEPHR